MTKKEIVEYATATVVLVAAIISANAYLAKASDLKLVEMRLDQKIVSDAIIQVEARKYQILDRNANARNCSDIKDEREKTDCRSQERMLQDLNRKYEILIKETTTKGAQ